MNLYFNFSGSNQLISLFGGPGAGDDPNILHGVGDKSLMGTGVRVCLGNVSLNLTNWRIGRNRIPCPHYAFEESP